MLLAADIGNTCIKFGIFDLSNTAIPICTFSLSSDPMRSSDEYEFFIRQLIELKKFNNTVDCCVISSVVPSITHTVAKAMSSICNSDPFIIGSGTKTGFKICIDSPSEFGADMVSNAAGALSVANGPIVIADFGTATTLSVIDKSQSVLGSVIMPGLKVSIDALSGSAELLSGVSLNKPRQLIGKNTADSIQSGVINGSVFMIDGFIRNIREDVCRNGTTLSLIATGGLSKIITPNLRNKFTVIDNLTLIGAAVLYKNNRNK